MLAMEANAYFDVLIGNTYSKSWFYRCWLEIHTPRVGSTGADWKYILQELVQPVLIGNTYSKSWFYTIPKEIDFRLNNMKCSGENVILRGIFLIVSCFPLHFMLYRGKLDGFSNSVQVLIGNTFSETSGTCTCLRKLKISSWKIN